MSDNVDHQTQIRIKIINDRIANLENEVLSLKRQKEALLNSVSHSPLNYEEKPVTTHKDPIIVKLVPAQVTEDVLITYAQNTAEKNSKGGFLGKGKILEKPTAWQKIWYPYYDVEMSITIRDVEKRGWLKKEEVTKTLSSRTSVDGVNGSIVNIGNAGISYAYAFLKNLSMDEVILLYYVSNISNFTIQDLRGLPQTEAKSRKIADGLAANGILTRTATRPAQYGTKFPYPSNPAQFVSLVEKYSIVENAVSDRILQPGVTASSIPSDFQRYWNKCDVLSSVLVYYPYFGIVYERENDNRVEIIDGVTGQRQEYLEQRITVQKQNLI